MLAGLLILATFLHASGRDWEQWDKGNVSEVIDAYWTASKEELEHRKILAALTQKWFLPDGRFLEIGCGSGLVYHALVPAIFPNQAYVGVDISQTMLDIATKRFSEGVFVKDDVYALSFPDNAFEVVAAFEVFGHLGDIQKPIGEMFRVASRRVIFTVWTASKTRVEQEVIQDAVFIHTTFSHEDVMQAIENALESKSYDVHTEPLSKGTVAYIIQKHGA